MATRKKKTSEEIVDESIEDIRSDRIDSIIDRV